VSPLHSAGFFAMLKRLQRFLTACSVTALAAYCGHAFAPQTEAATSAQHNLQFAPTATATPAATRLWYAFCNGCGIAMGSGLPPIIVNVYVAASGSLSHSFTFGFSYDPFVITSADQRHVYAAISRFGGNAVADIDPQTYAVRYYSVPILIADGAILGLAASPDGSRLYVPTSSNRAGSTLYVFNTVSRTVAATVAITLLSPAVSPDGRTLYGLTHTTSGMAIAAIDTGTFHIRTGVANTGGSQLVASATRLYVSSNSHVDVYDSSTLAFLTGIPVPSLPQGMAIDVSRSRIFVWISMLSSDEYVVVYTLQNRIIGTFSGVSRPPVVDSITHIVYGQFNGDQCEFVPAAYLRNCLYPAPTMTYGTTTD